MKNQKKNTTTSFRKLPPHWYYIWRGHCPVCGRFKEYRERRYTARPKRWEDRNEHLPDLECYCGCLG